MKSLILLTISFLLIHNVFSQSLETDSSFGNNGVAYTTLTDHMALQEDGKIVVSGANNRLSRYNQDGSLDTSFGDHGVQTSPIGITSLAIQKDGKIVAGGFGDVDDPYYTFAVARFNSNGSVDSTFSYDGIHIINFGTGDSYASAVSIQSNGKILLAGYAYTGSSYDFALARFNSNGSLDTSFSSGGKAVTDFGANDKANAMVLQKDGKIVLVGSANILGYYNEQIALARYNTDGSLDESFSNDGKQESAFPKDNWTAKAVAIQADGKIVVAGCLSLYPLFLQRYNTDGTIDTTFSEDGILTPEGGNGYSSVSLAIQPNGKIILGGGLFNQNDEDWWLTRYTPDGRLDKYFGNEGVKTINLFYNDASTTCLAISNNQLYVAGTGAIVRYLFSDVSNLFPTLSITTPFDNDTYIAGADIQINAIGKDIDGFITKVDFYNNGSLIGTTTKSPYTFTWKNLPAGDHVITAKATDNDLHVTTSNAVRISVDNYKVVPTVSIISPVDYNQFTAPASITITANTSDTDSSVSKVDFYNNDILIGSSTKRPYTFKWNNVTAGIYSITAKATAYNSYLITSQAVHISVSNTKVVPFISVTSPAAIDTFAAPASVTITASIRDTNSSIRKIDFYSNDSLLATVTKRPYTFTWKNVTAGIYFITAKATISDTLVITSHASKTTVFNTTSQTIIPPFVSITSPKASATFTAPASISISANASDTNGSITKVDFYNNDTLIGTVTQSPYIFIWKNVPLGNYFITAKATDNNGLLSVSNSVRVVVSKPKLAPYVSLTSPEPGTTLTAPASITISANASDTDGSISKVDFYNNDTLIGTSTQSPYTFTWENVPAGNYTITARAVDNDSMVSNSHPVELTVSNPKLAPYVRLTSPEPNTTLTVPASITIFANADDTDGSIRKVDFYNNDTLIGTSTQSPYAFTWENVPAGDYTIAAKATDNDDLVAISDPVQILVVNPSSNPGIAPFVSLVTPSANNRFPAPASITITANAQDTDGYISKIDFYNNDTLIGTTTDSPYTFTWKNVRAGNYSITAKATDNDSLVTTTDPIQISVYNVKVAPSVSITSPAADKTFAEHSTITITAKAEDTDGSIAKVEFYNNDTLLGTVTESPYTFALNNVNAGAYSLTAKAIDNDSIVTTSAAVPISVVANKAPLVSITSPADGENFGSLASILLQAAATDPDGKIAKVEFYNGNKLLSTTTGAPYNYKWENVAAGSYTIVAIATDDYGLKTSSQPVTVIVEAKDSIVVKCAPNPATSTMTISTAGFDQNKPLYVSVIASGIVVKMIEVTNSSQTIQLDVSSLVSGIYTLKLTCGDKVVSKQFLKI